MGSATTHALAEARQALGEVKADLALGRELLTAARVLGGSPQFGAAVGGGAAEPAERTALIERVFGARFGAPAVSVLKTVAAQRWSKESDVISGIEELGVRAIAASAAGAGIDSELLSFAAVVASDAELELALGNRLASIESRRALVESLLSAKAGEGTVAIVEQLVTQPRGRSLRKALAAAAALVADEEGFGIATVTSAEPLSAERAERLGRELSERYGRKLRVQQRVDARVLGGLRIQVGAEVIDGTVATRLDQARLQLA